jgi:hypothetical protein
LPNWFTPGGQTPDGVPIFNMGQAQPGPSNPPPAAAAPPRTATGTFTRRAFGGKVEVVQTFSDGSQEVIQSWVDKKAGEDAADLFRAAGLNPEFVDSLMKIIDGLYNNNIDPSSSQIMSAIYNSEAYKDRFKANEAIRQRIASGQSRPGDRMLSPKEYIDLENTYRQIFQTAGMPEGYYDQPDDFVTLISNSISAAEVQQRVRVASDALNRADSSVRQALEQYYGLSSGDLTAYLLDPAKAMPILEARAERTMTGAFGLNRADELERVYRSAEVGGMAGRQGLGVGRDMSEEIVDLGKFDMADDSFRVAGAADQDLRRLGRLYEQPLDFKDMVRESLNLSGGVDSGRRRRKLASQERAAFSGQSGLDRTSLRKMQDV